MQATRRDGNGCGGADWQAFRYTLSGPAPLHSDARPPRRLHRRLPPTPNYDILSWEEQDMSMFPVIQSPCTYQGRLSEIMDGRTCRMCKREVHDISQMSDRERRTFLQACEGE